MWWRDNGEDEGGGKLERGRMGSLEIYHKDIFIIKKNNCGCAKKDGAAFRSTLDET